MANPDVTRLINSEEIQSVVRPAKAKILKRPWTQKKNPLVNKGVLFRLNPYAKTIRRQELCESEISHWGADGVLMTSLYSEAGKAEEEWGKEAQDMLCWRDLLEYTHGSMMICGPVNSDCFVNKVLLLCSLWSRWPCL